jgi:hypothetical protein
MYCTSKLFYSIQDHIFKSGTNDDDSYDDDDYGDVTKRHTLAEKFFTKARFNNGD